MIGQILLIKRMVMKGKNLVEISELLDISVEDLTKLVDCE